MWGIFKVGDLKPGPASYSDSRAAHHLYFPTSSPHCSSHIIFYCPTIPIQVFTHHYTERNAFLCIHGLFDHLIKKRRDPKFETIAKHQFTFAENSETLYHWSCRFIYQRELPTGKLIQHGSTRPHMSGSQNWHPL